MIIEYGQEMFSHQIHNGSGKGKSVAVNGMPLVCVRHCAKHVKRPPRTHTQITPFRAQQTYQRGFTILSIFTDGEKSYALQLISGRKVQICLTPKLVPLITAHASGHTTHLCAEFVPQNKY